MQLLLQPLDHIVNNWTAVVMHERCEQPLTEARHLQCGKFPAPAKPVFIYRAFIFCQEMTGDPVYDHHTLASFLEVFAVESLTFHSKPARKPVCFLIGNNDHQRFTAVAAGGAVDLRTDLPVEPLNHFIQFRTIATLEKDPEFVVFCLLFSCNGG
jgi:hypothetical protein